MSLQKIYEVKQISPIRLKSTFVGKEVTKPGKATTILVEKVNLYRTDKKITDSGKVKTVQKRVTLFQEKTTFLQNELQK